MSVHETAKRVSAMGDDELRAAYEATKADATDTSLVIHHLAATELTKRGIGLGSLSPFHVKPAEVQRVTLRADDLPPDLAKTAVLPDIVDMVTVLDDTGFSIVLEPLDDDLWDFDTPFKDNDGGGWEESLAKADELQVGDFVSWNSSGGRAKGKVRRIVRTGSVDVPDSSFTIASEPDDPAVLITVWDDNGPTDTVVGHKRSTLTRIEPLKQEMAKTIRHEGSKWCVYSERTGRPFGCYPTKEEAEERLRQMEMFKADTPETFAPPAGVRAAARRAQGWIRDGKAGSGFTSTGSRRASQLAAGEKVSLDTIRRMRSFFARHEPDKKAKGFVSGEKGFPSPGRVAWDAWGGDAGKAWADRIYRRYAVDKDRPGESAWSRGYNTEYYEAKRDILSKGPTCALCKKAKATEVDHKRPLKQGGTNARSNLRAVCRNCNRKSGGSIRSDAKKSEFGWVSKSVDERRYTMGPMYIPNSVDAQGEWTDETELQQAVWDYVRSGDRRIRLQHNRDIVAGEWVEVLTWPYEVQVPMFQPELNAKTTQVMTFPKNTVFLGVVWEPWAWDLVKSGALRGYSIGGNAARVLADLPEA